MGNYRELLFYSTASVGANIAEGHGRHQGVEYVHYLIIAQGSANETDHWLNTALDCELGPEEKIKALILINNEVVRMLTATITTFRTKQGARNLREESASYFIETDTDE